MTKPDFAEPLVRAAIALKAAQNELLLGHHAAGRAKLWEVIRAINEASNASLDVSPP